MELERDSNLESPLTKRQYKCALDQFYAYRGSRDIVGTLVEEYLTIRKARGASQATRRLDLAALKWWARRVSKLAREQLAPEIALRYSQASEAIQEIKIKSTKQNPAGRHVPNAEIAAILNACKADPAPAGRRDAALIILLASTAARNQEIRLLTLRDISYTTRKDEHGNEIPAIEIKIKHGKGGKPRITYITGGAITALEAWLSVRGSGSGAIFNPITTADKILDRPLSYEATRLILERRAAEAGIPPINWHDFRRTGVGKLLNMNIDNHTGMTITGHAQVDTYLHYDHRPDDKKFQALLGLQIEF